MNLAVAQCLHRSDLCSLFFDHSRHGRKTDQRSDQEKDHRENLTDIFDTVCIVSIVRILRKSVTVCDDPLRFFQIVQFVLCIVYFLLAVFDFILRVLFAVFIIFLSVCQLLACIL